MSKRKPKPKTVQELLRDYTYRVHVLTEASMDPNDLSPTSYYGRSLRAVRRSLRMLLIALGDDGTDDQVAWVLQDLLRDLSPE